MVSLEDRVPIVIGIAGHRDIDTAWQKPALDGIRELFRELMAGYGATPFILLSPAEAGADRMVAKVALEPEFAARFRVIVPLPWHRDLARDRRPHTGAEELDGFLDLVHGTVNMDPTVTEADLACKADELWKRTGAFVARHSQILIAVWNGLDDPNSGTCRVIKWQREGRDTSYFKDLGVLDRPEAGPVYHFRVPRQNGPGADMPPKVVKHEVLPPEGRPQRIGIGSPLDAARNIDFYNRDMAELIPELGSLVAEGSRSLLSESDAAGTPRELQSLRGGFARADALARRMRKRADSMQCLLFGLIIAAFACIELYAHKFDEFWPLLAGYLVLVITAGLVHWRASSLRYQQRYLDYRALSEAFRVQFYWALAGLGANVADHYLRQFRSELDWIRQAVRNFTLASGVHSGSAVWRTEFGMDRRLELLREKWVTGQRSYLASTIEGTKQRHHSLELAKKATYWLAVAVACMLLAYHLCSGKADHIVLILVFTLAVASAMANEWDEKAGYGVDARRHQKAFELFAEAEMRLTAGDAKHAAIIHELGIEALSENADWVIQHRHRPVAPPSMS